MEEKFTLNEELVYGDTKTFISLLKFELMRISETVDNEDLLNIIEQLRNVSY